MLNVPVRPQPAAVAAVSALAATAGKTSSDEILIEQIAAGSKPAMQALFARHRTYVYRWLLRFVSNPIDGLDRFASTSSSPLAVHETHGRNLILPSVGLFSHCRESWRPIGASPGQQRPGDACHLVGKRNGHDLERSPRQELRQPGIVLRALLGAPQYGMRTDHEKASQVAVALLGNRPKLLFASG
jgi:hypothetical protein